MHISFQADMTKQTNWVHFPPANAYARINLYCFTLQLQFVDNGSMQNNDCEQMQRNGRRTIAVWDSNIHLDLE